MNKITPQTFLGTAQEINLKSYLEEFEKVTHCEHVGHSEWYLTKQKKNITTGLLAFGCLSLIAGIVAACFAHQIGMTPAIIFGSIGGLAALIGGYSTFFTQRELKHIGRQAMDADAIDNSITNFDRVVTQIIQNGENTQFWRDLHDRLQKE